MEQYRIKKILEGYDIQSEVDSIYGDWVVTKDGDLINIKWTYPIYSYEVNHTHWLAHLKEKKWFERSSFMDAFNRACKILGISVVLKEEF